MGSNSTPSESKHFPLPYTGNFWLYEAAVTGTTIQRLSNRPYSYSRYWTGTSLQWRLMRVIFSNANYMKLFLMILPRMSLHCKLVPDQYREYEYGILHKHGVGHFAFKKISSLRAWLTYKIAFLMMYTLPRKNCKTSWENPLKPKSFYFNLHICINYLCLSVTMETKLSVYVLDQKMFRIL